jgi:hypothetical protein
MRRPYLPGNSALPTILPKRESATGLLKKSVAQPFLAVPE